MYVTFIPQITTYLHLISKYIFWTLFRNIQFRVLRRRTLIGPRVFDDFKAYILSAFIVQRCRWLFESGGWGWAGSRVRVIICPLCWIGLTDCQIPGGGGLWPPGPPSIYTSVHSYIGSSWRRFSAHVCSTLGHLGHTLSHSWNPFDLFIV